MLDEQVKELQERNFMRTQEIIKQMGTKYLLHPANNVTRQKYKTSLRKAKRKYEVA
tara:strand:+ start:533 stop:700 length:168 start_codon:yes stop_codon:yes gene_type:complete